MNTNEQLSKPTDFNPLEWSKWLYEIRKQLFKGTSRAEAYRDCEQHLVEIQKEAKSD